MEIKDATGNLAHSSTLKNLIQVDFKLKILLRDLREDSIHFYPIRTEESNALLAAAISL